MCFTEETILVSLLFDHSSRSAGISEVFFCDSVAEVTNFVYPLTIDGTWED
jgi:hypothetical protein